MARFFPRHAGAIAALRRVRGTTAGLMTMLVVANAGVLMAVTAVRAEEPGVDPVNCCRHDVNGKGYCCEKCCGASIACADPCPDK
jgi:hypothetical protein